MKTGAAALGAALMILFPEQSLVAQRMTLPASGGHQKAAVSQQIGLVEVSVSYSGPSVVAPDGTDRRGKIWGGLVKYGLQKEDYGTCGAACPWRAGANENTVVRVSHPVLVEGKALAAGAYGLHMIPGAEEFTVIFSRNATSWGSYFYDPKEDVLRVVVKSRKAPFTPLLTYEFVERKGDRATLALRWDELEVPVSIVVENPAALWVENLARELRGQRGGTWQSWTEAAQYCLQSKVNLPEALKAFHDGLSIAERLARGDPGFLFRDLVGFAIQPFDFSVEIVLPLQQPLLGFAQLLPARPRFSVKSFAGLQQLVLPAHGVAAQLPAQEQPGDTRAYQQCEQVNENVVHESLGSEQLGFQSQ